jgi:pSer/pThr/pTyr-binding forkhead associated (FHA) protein/S1-C subfamily serine protease
VRRVVIFVVREREERHGARARTGDGIGVTKVQLRDLRDGRVYEFAQGPVVIGRSPDCGLVISGSGRELVSSRHARLVLRGDRWEVEDAGGRNGTFVDHRRVREGMPLALEPGQTLGLGELGPKFTVDLVPEQAAAPPVPASDEVTVPMPTYVPPRGPPAVHVILTRVPSGDRLEARGPVLRVGRGEECELRLAGEKIVSRVHCEIAIGADGAPVLRDAQSRNGTMLDGTPVQGEVPLPARGRIRLGPQGPELAVEHVAVARVGQLAAAVPSDETIHVPALATAPTEAPPGPRPPAAAAPAAPVATAERRSFGGLGRTVFVRKLIQETEQKHASRTRAVVWAFVLLLVAGISAVLVVSERRVRQTEAELADQRAALAAARAASDSVRAAAAGEFQQLSLALEQARAGSAPAAVVDSLRTALEDARGRTATLEAALNRARDELGQQLTAADSLRRATDAETRRLRQVLATSQAGGVSAAELESLRRAVRDAEERSSAIAAGLRAVRGADLARIAEANQAAVGLVSVFAGGGIYDGSGFVITQTGYFVTNRHVALPEGQTPDSIHITMADQQTGHRAQLVQAHPAGGPDLALLRIPRYVGPFVARADWDGTHARQGEPAALIGFPAGVAAALDVTRTVRTSMSAGIFSKVTPDEIQFDGFTVGGSSGSPVFNADGEVVAVHARGLREAAGLGFAVPIRLILPLLPEEAAREVRG